MVNNVQPALGPIASVSNVELFEVQTHILWPHWCQRQIQDDSHERGNVAQSKTGHACPSVYDGLVGASQRTRCHESFVASRAHRNVPRLSVLWCAALGDRIYAHLRAALPQVLADRGRTFLWLLVIDLGCNRVGYQ